MKIKKLFKDIYPHPIPLEFEDFEVTAIRCDSRQVKEGDVFVACQGVERDGAKFIDAAIQNGAKIIVRGSPNTPPVSVKGGVCFLSEIDPTYILRKMARRFYGNPSEKIRVAGITGTNGKTSIAYLLEAILKAAGKHCGVIGTVNHRMGKKIFASNNTTPGYLDNQRFLSMMVEEKMDYGVMEVSSHALDQGRVEDIDFRLGIFTNLTNEHLDYHQTKEEYFIAKSKLLTNLSVNAMAIINGDDGYGQKLLPMISSGIRTYGINCPADVMAKNIQYAIDGTTFTLISPLGEYQINTPLIGRHNVYNVLAAVAGSLAEGIAMKDIQQALKVFSCVPGRLEMVDCGQLFTIYIDYAHTPDALANVLQSIKYVSEARVILVFGCGGNRDKTKRAPMGMIASQLADISIVTSDNPRGEEPGLIIQEIMSGFENENFIIKENREEAIKEALLIAREGDIILIAGKGHEIYQMIGDQKLPFNERTIIQELINRDRP